MRSILALALASAAWAGCDTPQSRQFDFWLGEWDVQVENRIVARSRIEKLPGGCIIQENWMPFGGPEGKSWNFVDPATGQWKQVWVTAQGASLHAAGTWTNGAMRQQGISESARGRTHHRHSFIPLAGGRVRQFCEESDDGQTWRPVFDGLYLRRASAKP